MNKNGFEIKAVCVGGGGAANDEAQAKAAGS
jgi:hypothetical protein